MKALVYTAPEKVVYRDFDEPHPKEGELLVKSPMLVFVAQICTLI